MMELCIRPGVCTRTRSTTAGSAARESLMSGASFWRCRKLATRDRGGLKFCLPHCGRVRSKRWQRARFSRRWHSFSRMLAMRRGQVSGLRKLVMSGNQERWPWPDSLDALVAAPAHHQLLLEDQRARVLQTRIPAGDVVPLHTHRWGGVAYVQSCSHFIRRGEKG